MNILNDFFEIKVRIEDDIIIWQNGNENMNDELPRTIAEIEEFMEKGSFKKEH